MKRFLHLLLTLSLFAGAQTGSAQQKLQLSLDDAVRLSFDKSKSLHASLMKVQYADAKAGEVGTILLPSVKFNGGYTKLSDIPAAQFSLPSLPAPITLSPSISNNFNARVTVQQPLFTGYKFQRSVDIADFAAQATQKEFDSDKSSLTFNVKSAYWNLAKSFELQKVVDENVDQVKAHLKDVQNWLSQGLITNNEVLKVQVQLSDVRLRQIDAHNNVQLARIMLNNVIGLPLDSDVQLTTDLMHEHRVFDALPALINQAHERRPEIKSMQYRVQASDAAVSLAQSGWWPQLYLVGNYVTARPNQRIFPTQDVFKDTWDVGVSVSLDLWNWGTTVRQTDQAKAQLEQTRDGLGQLRDAVALEVTRDYLNLARARERISVAEQGVRQAEENYRVTSGKFKQGLALNTDLLDSEVALLQAKTNYAQAVADYELAEASLERSIGE
ncbi:MAG: TolC family protein [Ignavibacteriales bacterium]|nr:TolC family protein [Ignavibacteriales bacterium]